MSGVELIAVGAQAPEFALSAHDGVEYRLSTVLDERHAVLIFYPGNNTPG